MEAYSSVGICSVRDFFTSVIVPDMQFRPPTRKDALRAIGSMEGLSSAVKRALYPAGAFDRVPQPEPGDWLAEHSETGQPFDEFVGTDINRPDTLRNSVYLQSLGQFCEEHSLSCEMLRRCAAAFFSLQVKILPPMDVAVGTFETRINPSIGNSQILTSDVLSFLMGYVPDDAVCILAITMEDLYPHPSWNFVFGQASLRNRVGVFSFARYDPTFYGGEREADYRHILLRRSCKVLIHETAHMFSLSHCIYFRCVLNGSNHLVESDARPLFFCPVCLRKLQYSIGFDIVARYRNILNFCKNAGFDDDARWVSNRLKRFAGDE